MVFTNIIIKKYNEQTYYKFWLTIKLFVTGVNLPMGAIE